MPVAVKLDEDLPPMVGEPLQAVGCDVASVHGQGWGGLKDSDLWARLVMEHRLLVTADKGFADLRRFPPGAHAGILLLRPRRESIIEYRALLQTVIEKGPLDDLAGAIAVADPSGLRIRRR